MILDRPLNREPNLGPFSFALSMAYFEFVEAYRHDTMVHSYINASRFLNGREPNYKEIMEHIDFWGHSRAYSFIKQSLIKKKVCLIKYRL